VALLKIARMGHPALMTPAKPVEDPTAPEIRRLARDMVQTMADAGGVGLAAPQVHVGLRVVVYFVPPERGEAGEGVDLTVMVNPRVTPLGEETNEATEGCLSLPGMSGMVRRPSRVRVRYETLDGETVDQELSGYQARVVQHECDHLDGILYPMRMTDLSSLGYVEEKAMAEAMKQDEAEPEREAAHG